MKQYHNTGKCRQEWMGGWGRKWKQVFDETEIHELANETIKMESRTYDLPPENRSDASDVIVMDISRNV